MPSAPDSFRLSPGRALALTVASVALAVALAEVYQALRGVFHEGWLAAAILHSLVGLAVALHLARTRELGPAIELGTVAETAPEWLRRRPWLAFLPAAVVLLGTAALVLVSRQFGDPHVRSDLGTNPAWIFWVPLVEELTFRAGIGAAFRRHAPLVWGVWFGAVTFALVHASPTLANLAALKVGLPVGPLLLGLMCEALYAKTGRLVPAVALHAACNATVAIFAMGDDRWLVWLGFLYG